MRKKKVDPDLFHLNKLTPQEERIRLYYLSAFSKSDFFVKLYVLFEEHYPLFLDLFHGANLKVPPLRYLKRLETHCKIYTYLKCRKFTSQAFVQASRKFNRKESTLRNIAERITKALDSFDVRKYLKDV